LSITPAQKKFDTKASLTILKGSCTLWSNKTCLALELWTRVGPRKHVLDGAQIPYA